MSVDVRALAGPDFDAALPALCELRIKVFRAWPYLYDGDLAYEAGYLARFKDADQALEAAERNSLIQRLFSIRIFLSYFT